MKKFSVIFKSGRLNRAIVLCYLMPGPYNNITYSEVNFSLFLVPGRRPPSFFVLNRERQ